MSTYAEVIKAGYPGISEDLIEYVLWGMTAYPFTTITAKELFNVANRFKRAENNGYRLCDFCSRIAVERDLCEKHLAEVKSWRTQ